MLFESPIPLTTKINSVSENYNMCDAHNHNEEEPFNGFKRIEDLDEQTSGLFAFVMGLSGDGAGVGGLNDLQKIQRIEQRLLQEARD